MLYIFGESVLYRNDELHNKLGQNWVNSATNLSKWGLGQDLMSKQVELAIHEWMKEGKVELEINALTVHRIARSASC